MITSIELGNVRVFDGIGNWKFPISPVTVFCGTNSAGKSTIFKSLLLLMQTNSEGIGESTNGRLRLAGPIVDLGTFESYVSHRDLSKELLLGVSAVDRAQVRNLNRLRSLRKLPKAETPDNRYGPYNIDSRFYFGVLQKGLPDPQMPLSPDLAVEKGAQACTHQAFLKRATFTLRTDDGMSLDWQVHLNSEVQDGERGPSYMIEIPGDYFGFSNGFTMMDVEESESGNVMIPTFIKGLLPIGLWAKPKRGDEAVSSEQREEFSYFPLPPLIREAMTDLAEQLNHIHYIGPLRSPAKRYYMTNLDSAPSLDSAGDFLPYVLRDARNTQIVYAPPDHHGKISHGKLSTALGQWLHYLRTGEKLDGSELAVDGEIGVASTKDVLVEFVLQSFGGELHALADSGFGYSQVLPILVRSLIARPDSLIAIEQPELHLNPALQVRLVEFLVALALCRKVVLIETHSEHIVNALRVLAAEDQSNVLSESSSIYFLDTEYGYPVVKNLEIQEDGTVPEWPRQFMGEALSLSARLLRAQGQSRGKTSEK